MTGRGTGHRLAARGYLDDVAAPLGWDAIFHLQLDLSAAETGLRVRSFAEIDLQLELRLRPACSATFLPADSSGGLF